jgi:G3E family GTPase
LINEDQKNKITDFVQSINPSSTIIYTNFSIVDLNFFLEESAFGLNDKIINFNEVEKIRVEHKHFHEEDDIENIVIYTDLNTKEELDKRIGKILWELSEPNKFSLIRYKGIFYEKDTTKIYSIQGIYDLYEINELQIKDRKEEGQNLSKILFIGKNVEQNKFILNSNLNY